MLDFQLPDGWVWACQLNREGKSIQVARPNISRKIILLPGMDLQYNTATRDWSVVVTDPTFILDILGMTGPFEEQEIRERMEIDRNQFLTKIPKGFRIVHVADYTWPMVQPTDTALLKEMGRDWDDSLTPIIVGNAVKLIPTASIEL